MFDPAVPFYNTFMLFLHYLMGSDVIGSLVSYPLARCLRPVSDKQQTVVVQHSHCLRYRYRSINIYKFPVQNGTIDETKQEY